MKLAIVCLLALTVPSLATGQTSQYIFGSQAGQPVLTTGQSFIGLMPRNDIDISALTPNPGNTYALMPTTGTFSTFCVNLTTAPGTGATWIWSLYKNGLDESISVNISGTTTQACDLVDTAGFAPGDLVSLHVTPSSSPAPAATHASWYIVQTPVVPGETILFTSQGLQGGGGSAYFSLAGNSSSLGTETAMATIIPTAGTITKFIAEEVGTGGTASATLDQNESSTSPLLSMTTSGASVEQSENLSVLPGDVFDVNMTGFTSTTAAYASVVFVPAVPGQFVIPTWRNITNDPNANNDFYPQFYLPLSGRSNDNLEPTEALAQQIGGIAQIEAVFVRETVAPGSGAQYAFTLRDNGANTSLNTTLSGTNLTACTTTAPVAGCVTGSAVTVNNFDFLDTSVVPTGDPATSANDYGAAVSYLAYVPQLVFSTEPSATGTTGTVLSPVVVELQDQNGNPLSGSSAQVTISSSPAGVSGTLTVNAVNGVATFSNLEFATQGTYTLSASASGLTVVTSTSISIAAAVTSASLSSPVTFPNTLSGTTSAALAATLSNTGTAALNNIVPTITGANPSDFAISTGANACGATLAAGSSCSIYVTFTPASATSFSATLSVADSATGSPQTASLTGTGTAAAGSLTASLAFPNTPTGTTSASLAATLSNTGTAALNNIVPTITGTNPSDFAISTGANACGTTLAAGSTCSIYITFTPASATGFSAILSVADSATGSPQTATLTGTGTAAVASLTASLPFPNTVSGTTSTALAATLSNTGAAALNNIVPSITGTNPNDFAISAGANACGVTLAAGSSCSIYITFTPASATSFSATLSVADSATGSPQTATLTGTGTAAAASLTASLAFPNTPTGTTSPALAATLSNTGTATLNNIVPTITGMNPSDFVLSTGTNACGATLAAGSTCSIYINFTPASAASFSATLSVADSAPGSPQTSSLTGTGTAAAASLTASLAFPNTVSGTASTALAATLSNTGTASLNNIVPTITGTNPSEFALSTGTNECGATLAAGSSCSIYITFTPASATSFSATLSVADSATGSPQTATLTGTGTAVPIPSFTVTGTAVSVSPGATSGNTSTISVTPSGGFTGSVTLTAAVTSSPTGAEYPPTLSFGSTSPVNISGASAGTATLTISTTAPTSSTLALPKRPGNPWAAASGVAFACLLLFGIPARRRSWATKLGMLALLLTFAGELIACGGSGGSGGGGGGGGGGIAGTTAGSYTVTVTGISGTTTETGTITLTVQ